ncbi:hypothetical protein BC940DRAFT_316330 [Gongronella butleri]|nr:hypothetical protein BC940DRAFT_316330 [Gongronella butleri]
MLGFLFLQHCQLQVGLIDKRVNETELVSRYILRLLSAPFDDAERNLFVRFTSDATLESTKDDTLTHEHPDLTASKLSGVKWASSHAYGEVKSCEAGADNYSICLYMFRIAKFTRNAFDKQDMRGMLDFQAVGTRVSFLLLVEPVNGMYVPLELVEIKLPESVADLMHFVVDIQHLLMILNAFHGHCIQVT